MKELTGNFLTTQDELDYIIEYENGNLSDLDTLKLFKQLIKTGKCWKLQGHYGRTAQNLIDEEYLLDNGDFNNDKLLDIGVL